MSRVICSYSLPPEVVNQLLETSKHQDRPVSWIVRDSLTLYLARAIGMAGGEVAPPGESSELPFDLDLSLRIDQVTVLIEAETDQFWRSIFISYRSFLEQGITYEN